MTRKETIIYQSLLDEHGGNFRLAFEDLVCRTAAILEGVSWGAMRAPPFTKTLPVKAAPPRALDVAEEDAPHG